MLDMTKTEARSRLAWLDGFAMSASGLCLVHCLVLPLLVLALPAAALLARATEPLHLWILVAAVPTSLYALGSSAVRTGKPHLLAGGCIALTLLFLGLWFENYPLPAAIFTVMGSMLLAICHLRNWRLRTRGPSHR